MKPLSITTYLPACSSSTITRSGGGVPQHQIELGPLLGRGWVVEHVLLGGRSYYTVILNQRTNDGDKREVQIDSKRWMNSVRTVNMEVAERFGGATVVRRRTIPAGIAWPCPKEFLGLSSITE